MRSGSHRALGLSRSGGSKPCASHSCRSNSSIYTLRAEGCFTIGTRLLELTTRCLLAPTNTSQGRTNELTPCMLAIQVPCVSKMEATYVSIGKSPCVADNLHACQGTNKCLAAVLCFVTQRSWIAA